MASLIWVTTEAMISLSWVSSCLRDSSAVASTVVVVAGVGVLLMMVWWFGAYCYLAGLHLLQIELHPSIDQNRNQ